MKPEMLAAMAEKDTRVDAWRAAAKVAGRRQKCRRGTQECVRHAAST